VEQKRRIDDAARYLPAVLGGPDAPDEAGQGRAGRVMDLYGVTCGEWPWNVVQ